MSDETARTELIQRLHEAARVERAETIRNLLRRLLRRERERDEQAWPCQPAIGDCR